jgi:hypothetical protein
MFVKHQQETFMSTAVMTARSLELLPVLSLGANLLKVAVSGKARLSRFVTDLTA